MRVSRRTLKVVMSTTNLVLRSNSALSLLFSLFARGIPLVAIVPQSGPHHLLVMAMDNKLDCQQGVLEQQYSGAENSLRHVPA